MNCICFAPSATSNGAAGTKQIEVDHVIAAPNKTYSITEAARVCDINRVTLWRWIKSGRLRAHQTPTGHYKIRQEDLEVFVQRDLTFLDLPLTGIRNRVLLIDDDAAFRKFVRRALEGHPLEIQEASNGFEAGLKVVKFKPALLILDLYMPEMDGFEICKMIKEDPGTADILILAVTGFNAPETEARIRANGADAYLGKPLRQEDLINCVQALLQTGRYGKETPP
jgi:excisionase family DNA binding protein